MVRGLAASDAPSLQPVSGRPGSGKTYATATYVRALVADGIPVVGCALAATAAAQLEDSCRFGPLTGREASTIARLLRQLDRQPLPTGAVVIVDEASMVGTRDLHRLATHVQAASGSLKLIGDPKPHGAVASGAGWVEEGVVLPNVHEGTCSRASATLAATPARSSRRPYPSQRPMARRYTMFPQSARRCVIHPAVGAGAADLGPVVMRRAGRADPERSESTLGAFLASTRATDARVRAGAAPRDPDGTTRSYSSETSALA